jgi:hypothetical protein
MMILKEDEYYPVPEEVDQMFIEAEAAYDCRDSAIKNLFGFKRALKYAEIAVKKGDDAWNAVYKLYPELRKRSLSHVRGKGVKITSGMER